MKSALKRIFGGSSHPDSLVGGGGITVKHETVCYTKSGLVLTKGFTPKGTNPLNRYGNSTKCQYVDLFLTR